MSEQLGFDLIAPAGPRTVLEITRAARAAPPRPLAAQNLDALCQGIVSRNPAMLVPWFLMASWAYYQCDAPLLTDGAFDVLCRMLAENWHAIEHRHKPLIDRAWLIAGTCALARDRYPATVKGAAAHLASCRLAKRLPRD